MILMFLLTKCTHSSSYASGLPALRHASRKGGDVHSFSIDWPRSLSKIASCSSSLSATSITEARTSVEDQGTAITFPTISATSSQRRLLPTCTAPRLAGVSSAFEVMLAAAKPSARRDLYSWDPQMSETRHLFLSRRASALICLSIRDVRLRACAASKPAAAFSIVLSSGHVADLAGECLAATFCAWLPLRLLLLRRRVRRERREPRPRRRPCSSSCFELSSSVTCLSS